MIPLNPRPAASKSAASARRAFVRRASRPRQRPRCSPGRQARVTEKLKECESRASGGGIKAPGSGWSIDAPQVEGLPDREFPLPCGAGRQPRVRRAPGPLGPGCTPRRSRGGILLRKARWSSDARCDATRTDGRMFHTVPEGMALNSSDTRCVRVALCLCRSSGRVHRTPRTGRSSARPPDGRRDTRHEAEVGSVPAPT